MEYQALYRKYRPQRFDEVVGQDHVTQTLAREVVEGKIAHAYLFAGPRGTGKTTTARLLAKALNCTNRAPDGEPCNECASCLGIAEGTSLDVIELDAASHNKVEDVREIRVNVGTVASVGGAKRVYILDEAHMLSRAAGNALLKTLEEPPDHVVFVLATTEPYKLLDTIRSRSQRFDFHPVPVETLIEYLEVIAGREGFTVDPQGLAMVAQHARGSVRDAMSLLEQVAALGGGAVDAATVGRALGLADSDAFVALADAIVGQDAPAGLGLVARLASEGSDLRRFVGDAIAFFRGVFLAQYAPNLEDVADEPMDTIEMWRRQAKKVPTADVLRAIDHLSEALMQLRQGREERLVLELAVLRLTRPDTSTDAASLAARVKKLEDRISHLAAQLREGGSAPASGATGVSQPSRPAATPQPMASPPEPKKPAPTEPAAGGASPASTDAAGTDAASDAGSDAPSDAEVAADGADVISLAVSFEQVATAWPAMLAKARERAGSSKHALLIEASPTAVEGKTVVATVPAHLPFHLDRLSADTALQGELSQIAKELIGVPLRFVFRPQDAPPPTAETEEEERVPDKDTLRDADAGDDPAAMVVDLLGGEVITD